MAYEDIINKKTNINKIILIFTLILIILLGWNLDVEVNIFIVILNLMVALVMASLIFLILIAKDFIVGFITDDIIPNKKKDKLKSFLGKIFSIFKKKKKIRKVKIKKVKVMCIYVLSFFVFLILNLFFFLLVSLFPISAGKTMIKIMVNANTFFNSLIILSFINKKHFEEISIGFFGAAIFLIFLFRSELSFELSHLISNIKPFVFVSLFSFFIFFLGLEIKNTFFTKS